MKFNKLIIVCIIALFLVGSTNSSNLQHQSNSNSEINLENKFGKLEDKLLTVVTKKTKPVSCDSIQKLENHLIDCDIGVLSSKTLKKQGPYKCYMEYKCIRPTKCNEECIKELKRRDAKDCKNLSTKPEDSGKDEKNSLDALRLHKLKCPENYLLTKEQLRSKRSPNKFYTNYTCCPAKVRDCKEITLKWKSLGKKSIQDLADYKIQHENPDMFAINSEEIVVDYAKKSYSVKANVCLVVG